MLNAGEKLQCEFYEKRIGQLVLVGKVAFVLGLLGYGAEALFAWDQKWLYGVPGIVFALTAGYAVFCHIAMWMIRNRSDSDF